MSYRVLGLGPVEVKPQTTLSVWADVREPFDAEWFFVTEGDVEGLYLAAIRRDVRALVLSGTEPVAASVFQVRDMADILQLRDIDAVQDALARWRVRCGVWHPCDRIMVAVENRADRPKRFSAAFAGAAPEPVPL